LVGGLIRMKRLTIFAIILAGFAVLCSGQYRSRAAARKIIQLTEPKLAGSLSLEEALVKRRGVREFIAEPLSLVQIGQLAWAGQGTTQPQAGLQPPILAEEQYPVKLYLVTPGGLFVYHRDSHTLEQTSDRDLRAMLAAATAEPKAVAEAGCDIIIAGSVRKLAARYGKEARKYMLLEAGHIAQSIQLQAVSLQLGSVPVGTFRTRNVSRVCRLPKEMEPIYIICAGHPAEWATDTEQQSRPKRAVLITASENFRDEELFETKLVLEEAGVQTVIASSRPGLIRGMLGGTAEVAVLVNELNVGDFDAIVFIGGPGAMEYFDNPVAWSIVRDAADKGKILAAICIAPTVLANAGVLSGVRATSFLSERERLQQAGVKYTGTPVERDGLIITARDPAAAGQFGTAIADALIGR
jgi:protease I